MSKNTVTIPADFGGSIFLPTPNSLRDYADTLDGNCTHRAGAAVLRYLADEIERQAPRAEGWYHVRHHNGVEKVLHWDGQHWNRAIGGGIVAVHEGTDPRDEITPVTIGGAS